MLKEKRQAAISRAVTKGLDSSVPMKDSGLSYCDSIPKHWQIGRIGAIAKVGNGSTPSRENPDYWQDGGYPWLSSTVVNQEEVTEATEFITEKALKECHLPQIKPPAILVGITGQGRTRGMATLLQIEATINQHIAYVVPRSSDVNIHFLHRLFDMLYTELRMESEGGGSTKGAITCEQIQKIRLPLPPLEEQNAIVDRIFRHGLRHFFLLHNAEHMIELLSERRSALISAAVTGKINVMTQVAKPIRSTWSSGFAHQVLAAETLSRCNGPRMGRIKLQKLIHLCEYHAQLDELHSEYSRKAAGPFDAKAMAGISKGLLKQRWFEEYKDESRYAYRPLEKAGGHKQYLSHWEDKQAKIDQVLNLLGGARTRSCEIASTLYAAWNDLLIEGKNPTDAEIIHEASSAERWHASKEKIAVDKWPKALAWMRAKGLVPVGYGAHTKRKSDQVSEEVHEPA